ncbi:MAG: 2-C-methyl-D-erythritol 4-phosphate cytidylyltransferase [Legionellales bacterium]|nr:2-C-methyl-D-erythritol 4-phosphate cytidylyltransferase [Legionellales bacterium]|tara:strand:- start:4589 stop:5293 length:705 start_codon:yes stop_codon:yes gene_type:complete
MSNNNRLWVVIPAAGIGKRMGVDIPKQYITVCDKAIIEHTVEKFTSRNDLQGILVALSNSDQHWSTLELSKNNKITTVTGGEERYKSVYNALCSLKNKADDDDWILVHDAVRPCITTSEIDQFIADLDHLNGIGGILALPCFETMKKANTNHEIEETIDRKFIWHAQTPQMFRYKKLFLAIEKIMNENIFITDEAMAMELAGYKPILIQGTHSNIKITDQNDLKYLESFLRQEI